MEVDRKRHFFFPRGVSRRLKASAVTGLIVLAPFAATLLFIQWFLGFFNGFPGAQLFQVSSYALVNQFIKLGMVVSALGVSAIGVGRVFSTKRGERLEKRIDSIFTELPVIGTVYSITKTAADTVFRRTEDFEDPVKLSYQGLRLTAFQTGNSSSDGRKMVFVPTSPNITSGFVIEVEEDRLEETDESLEQAFTKVLSAGFSN
jgi:uncharacterized membrane protein